MTLFERATRNDYRFKTDKGELDVTDLWKLPLTSKRGVSLNKIALDLDGQLSAMGTRSFVKSQNNTPERKMLTDKLEVVKRIIEVREEEADLRSKERERAALKEQLEEALAKKQAENILNLSEDELRTRLSELDS